MIPTNVRIQFPRSLRSERETNNHIGPIFAFVKPVMKCFGSVSDRVLEVVLVLEKGDSS